MADGRGCKPNETTTTNAWAAANICHLRNRPIIRKYSAQYTVTLTPLGPIAFSDLEPFSDWYPSPLGLSTILFGVHSVHRGKRLF